MLLQDSCFCFWVILQTYLLADFSALHNPKVRKTFQRCALKKTIIFEEFKLDEISPTPNSFFLFTIALMDLFTSRTGCALVFVVKYCAIRFQLAILYDYFHDQMKSVAVENGMTSTINHI